MRPTGVDVDVRRMRRTFPCFRPAMVQDDEGSRGRAGEFGVVVVASVTVLPQLPLQAVYLPLRACVIIYFELAFMVACGRSMPK